MTQNGITFLLLVSRTSGVCLLHESFKATFTAHLSLFKLRNDQFHQPTNPNNNISIMKPLKTSTRIPRNPLSRAGILGAALLASLTASLQASTAYGSLSNFDVVNDTGGKCYGFEIELDDVVSTSITYMYDYNHYGRPTISQDNTDPAHPKVHVRYAAVKNPNGTFASFTNPQDPLNPLPPTGGHAFTNPGVNLGGEHFGVGYYGAPSLVKYNWIVESPSSPGTLILGPAVYVASPIFTYIPPIPFVAPAQIQAVIVPPPPEIPDDAQFGVPVWVKVFKTVQPSGHKVVLKELVTDDELVVGDPHWDGGEVAETEIEWQVFQKRPASNPGGAGVDEKKGADDLPNGDEMVTRRYEFYVYSGPVVPEDGEAQCDNPDNCPGALGAYIGAQMAGFDAIAPLGLIDNLQEGETSDPYLNRTVVVGGNTPYTLTITAGALPPGLAIDPDTGVFSGTPTTAGLFAFSLHAKDADNAEVSKAFTVKILAGLSVGTANLPAATEKAPYSLTLLANGGTAPYSWSSTPLPAGLSLSFDGLLSGTPSVGAVGSHPITFTVDDNQGKTASVSLTILINAAPKPKRGDVNNDGFLNQADLNLVLAARNIPASGPNDPRDLDHDGKITVLDARILVNLINAARP